MALIIMICGCSVPKTQRITTYVQDCLKMTHTKNNVEDTGSSGLMKYYLEIRRVPGDDFAALGPEGCI
jgi:hypothetical protein